MRVSLPRNSATEAKKNVWCFPTSLKLHLGRASAILTPRGHPCLDVAQGQHGGTRLIALVCFVFLIQKPMGSGSQGLCDCSTPMEQSSKPLESLAKTSGKIYETERSDEKTLPLWL